MLKEFIWVEPRKLAMTKKLFSESELSLAKCLNLEIDYDNMIVYAQLETTAKRALYEFIQESFRAFSHNLDNANYRNEFYGDLSARYDELYTENYELLNNKLPYWNTLRPNQTWGLATILYKKHNLLAWSMRTGKTIVAASMARIINARRTLIICPAIGKGEWFTQLSTQWKFNPLHFTVLDAQKSKTLRAFQEKFVVVNYDILGKYMEDILKENFELIILDEVHYVKGIGTSRGKAVRKIIDNNPKARTVFLSGTIIRNRCNDIYAYLRLTDHPLGDNYAKFLRDFTHSTSGRYGALKVGRGRNLDDLFRKTSNYMIVMKAEDCINLPPIVIYKYRLELADYRDEYIKIVKEMAEQKDVSNLSSSIHSLNRVTSKSKIKEVIACAEMIISQDRKVVIFTGYTDSLNLLEEYFKDRCVRIDGSVASHKRGGIVEQFWKDENKVAFIGNRQACGEVINLSNASDVIHVDFSLIPSDMEQANARVSIHDKKQNIGLHLFFAEESIDDDLFDLISEKSEDISALMDRNGNKSIDQRSIPEVLFKNVVENYLKNNPKKIDIAEIVV